MPGSAPQGGVPNSRHLAILCIGGMTMLLGLCGWTMAGGTEKAGPLIADMVQRAVSGSGDLDAHQL